MLPYNIVLPIINLIEFLASSVLGMYALFPPVQCVEILATLKQVQGGEAQITSGLNGMSFGVTFKRSFHNFGWK